MAQAVLESLGHLLVVGTLYIHPHRSKYLVGPCLNRRCKNSGRIMLLQQFGVQAPALLGSTEAYRAAQHVDGILCTESYGRQL
jgi:hypothetical protein